MKPKWDIQISYITIPPDDACQWWESSPKRVILHYTATSYDAPLSAIVNGHKARFWVKFFIAYHYVIDKEWKIYNTRPEKCWSIAMKTEYLNLEGINIAYIGNDKPTEKQRQSLILLTRDIMSRYNIEKSFVDAHADFESKNHKESMEWMFGSKENFVNDL